MGAVGPQLGFLPIHYTVNNVREEGETTGEIPQLNKTIGADGKKLRKLE